MDLEELRHWRRMTHEQFAKTLGVSVVTLWRWRKNGVPKGPAEKLVIKLEEAMHADQAAKVAKLDPWKDL